MLSNAVARVRHETHYGVTVGAQATDEPALPTSDVVPNALDRCTLLIKPGQTFDKPLTRLRGDSDDPR
jgi:hypothetical protein